MKLLALAIHQPGFMRRARFHKSKLIFPILALIALALQHSRFPTVARTAARVMVTKFARHSECVHRGERVNVRRGVVGLEDSPHLLVGGVIPEAAQPFDDPLGLALAAIRQAARPVAEGVVGRARLVADARPFDAAPLIPLHRRPPFISYRHSLGDAGLERQQRLEVAGPIIDNAHELRASAHRDESRRLRLRFPSASKPSSGRVPVRSSRVATLAGIQRVSHRRPPFVSYRHPHSKNAPRFESFAPQPPGTVKP